MQDWTTRVGTGRNPGSDSENWRSETEVRLDLRVGVRGRDSDRWVRVRGPVIDPLGSGKGVRSVLGLRGSGPDV
jgi:hypothetical protein